MVHLLQLGVDDYPQELPATHFTVSISGAAAAAVVQACVVCGEQRGGFAEIDLTGFRDGGLLGET